MLEELSFLDMTSSEKLRHTISVGGGSQFPPPERADCETMCNTPTSSYSYPAKRNVQRSDPAVEAAQLVSDSISSYIAMRSASNDMKHMHIWLQLEKLFEQLPEDDITDLNFKYVLMAYEAVLERRNELIVQNN